MLCCVCQFSTLSLPHILYTYQASLSNFETNDGLLNPCLNFASSSLTLTTLHNHSFIHLLGTCYIINIFFTLTLGLVPASSKVRAIILMCSMVLFWTHLNHLILAAPLTLSSVSLWSFPMTNSNVLYLSANVNIQQRHFPHHNLCLFYSFFPTVKQTIATRMNMNHTCFIKLYY